MNWTKFFIAFIAAFVFTFFFGFVWHGILMKPAYLEIASHYRAHDDMQWGPMILGHALMAFFLTWIIARFGGGVRLGALIGLFCVGVYFVRFAVEPLTPKVVLLGGIGDVLQLGIAAAIIAAIYKPTATSA